MRDFKTRALHAMRVATPEVGKLFYETLRRIEEWSGPTGDTARTLDAIQELLDLVPGTHPRGYITELSQLFLESVGPKDNISGEELQAILAVWVEKFGEEAPQEQQIAVAIDNAMQANFAVGRAIDGEPRGDAFDRLVIDRDQALEELKALVERRPMLPTKPDTSGVDTSKPVRPTAWELLDLFKQEVTNDADPRVLELIMDSYRAEVALLDSEAFAFEVATKLLRARSQKKV